MKRKALFVGVNEYEDSQIRNLSYSLSDAHALKTMFELFGYQTDILENPAKSAVFSAVKNMTSDLGAGDLFLFYFAGHGWTTSAGKHLLFCKDDMYEYLRYDYNVGIPFDFLKKVTEGGYNRAFVLDACRSDFLTGTRGGDTTTRDLRPIGELVRDAPARSSLAVLRSCSPYEHALEIDSRKHGLFTLAMLDVLRASKDNGSELLFGESFCDAVTCKMRLLAREVGVTAEQTPEFAKSGAAQVLITGNRPQVRPLVEPLASAGAKLDVPSESKAEPAPIPGSKPWPIGAKAGERRTFKIQDNVAMDFVWCPATTDVEWMKISHGVDTFTMGSPVSEIGRKADEFLHPVRLSRGFWIATCPVMQIQWEGVMGMKANRSPMMKGAEKPVTNVSYDDAMAFIGKIRGFGCPVALPTEAQWEYACRAGKGGSFGAGENSLLVPRAKRPGLFATNLSVLLHIIIPYFGWIVGIVKLVIFGGRPAPLKQFSANNWGIYDMHGNCGEWCSDWYGPYPSAEVTDPRGPESGPGHVVRGMRKIRWEMNCRSATRWWLPVTYLFAKYVNPVVGLRLVINPMGET